MFDFVNNETVADIEKVPEDFRNLYVQDGDSWKLNRDDDTIGGAISALLGQGKALGTSRNEVRFLKGKLENAAPTDLSPLSTYGSTPEEIAEGVSEAIKTAGKGKGEELDRQITKIKADLTTAHQKELDGKEGRIKTLASQLDHVLRTGAVMGELASAGAVNPKVLAPSVLDHVKVFEDETTGEFNVQVVDAQGDPRMSHVSGEFMSIKELVSEMKGDNEFKPFFKSEAPSGGGTPARRTPVRVPGKRDTSDMSPTEKIDAGLKKGQHRDGRGGRRWGAGEPDNRVAS